MSKEEKKLKFRNEGSLLTIYWEGGGEVPKALSGKFTSQVEAQKAIDSWQSTKPENKKRKDTKVTRNGEKQD